MKDGQPFNPYRMFVGSFIPNVIMRWPKISSTAKLAYARLCQYAGERGEAFPKVATLAEELGIQRWQMTQVINQLERVRLIRRVRPKGAQRLMHAPTRYVFLWHKLFEVDGNVCKNTPPDVWSTTRPSVCGTTRPIEEIQKEESFAARTLARAAASRTPPLRGDGDNASWLIKLFRHLWRAHYGREYPWVNKANPLAAKLWKHLGQDKATARKVLQRYFANTDPFYNGHPFATLNSQLPRFLVDPLPRRGANAEPEVEVVMVPAKPKRR